MIPRPLWHDAQDLSRLRAAISAEDPYALDLLTRARALVKDPCPQSRLEYRPSACAVVALVDGCERAAVEGLQWLRQQDYPTSELGLAGLALRTAVLADGCWQGWSEADQTAVCDLLARLCRDLRSVRKGNPHTVTNNWWAVSHSGGLIAGLAAQARGRTDLDADCTFHLQRILAFCQHFGNIGLYHEGLGYQGYTCSHLIPALHAAERRGLIKDVRDAMPGIRHMCASICACTVSKPCAGEEGSEQIGLNASLLNWNDAGFGIWNDGSLIQLLRWADADSRPHLLACYRQLYAIASSAPESPGPAANWCGWWFDLLNHPFDCSPAPTVRLPRHFCDHRQGLAVLRNRWQDADDIVLGVYAKATHAGGHSHADAGSLRLIGLGHDWIVGGGQNRPRAAWQSKVTAVDPPKEQKAGLGSVMWWQPDAAGLVMGMDLRKDSMAYHERWIAARFDLGPALVLLTLDLIDDHLTRSWDWNLSPGPGIDCHLGDDGFVLQAGDARLRALLLANTPLKGRLERMPDTKRSYSSGETVAYPGRPWVAMRAEHVPHLALLSLMVLDRGDVPVAQVADDLTISIGQRQWANPLADALPAGWRLSTAGGSAPYPGGLDFSPSGRVL